MTVARVVHDLGSNLLADLRVLHVKCIPMNPLIVFQLGHDDHEVYFRNPTALGTAWAATCLV